MLQTATETDFGFSDFVGFRHEYMTGLNRSCCNCGHYYVRLSLSRSNHHHPLMQTRSRSSRSSSGASAPDPAGASAPKNAAATSSGRIWTEAEEIVMIDFLVARKAEVSDEATFKKPVWNQVSKQFGSRWDADQCQAKWSRVRLLYLGASSFLILSISSNMSIRLSCSSGATRRASCTVKRGE